MTQLNHRVRVAAVRRQRMRDRLIQAALMVFGRVEGEPGAVDDVIRQAQVSRGTFYNYFRNADDLLRAVATQAGNELMQAVAPVVERRGDPAERVAAGVRSWMALVQEYPQLAAFFRRAGLYVLEADQVRADVSRDVIAGMASRRFTIKELELGFVLVAGTVLAAINTLAIGNVPRTYGSKISQRILMSLGIAEIEARAIAGRRLAPPQLPPGSLILRSFS